MPHLIGDWVQALDAYNDWFDAKVVSERGEGEAREVKVHFHGWKPRWDEWILAESNRLKGEDEPLPDHDWGGEGFLEDGQYEVERLLKKRKRKHGNTYLVAWRGHDEDGLPWEPSWEPESNVDQQLIDELEDPPESPKVPFVLAQTVTIPAAVADTLVTEWVDDIGRKAATLLARQREEFASRRLFTMSPCPAWLFCALHRSIGDLADAPGDVSDISAVRGARGGKFVEDMFSITATDLVKQLVARFNAVGHGALVLRENKTAVMLVPPLDFSFRTRREEHGGSWPTELVVTGHFMCLVDRSGPKGPRWAFDDARAEYDATNKHAYKLAVAAAMSALGEAVPARVRDFLALLK